MGKWKTSGNLIIANETFKIDAPVVNWREGPRWDATSVYCQPTDTDPRPPCIPMAGKPGHVPYGKIPSAYVQRYMTRPALRRYGNNPPLEAVKSVIRQFVVHHDGCASSDMAFSVMQNERGLSCHFLIDNDGTIFQTIDLALAAYHAAEWNSASIGVELCNRGDVKLDPNYYSKGKHGPNRNVVPCKINGHTFLAFDYTPAQYTSFQQLGRALLRFLPNLPAEYPQSSPGVAHWGTLPAQGSGGSFGFAGYIAHYHLTGQKWDPGPFDFKKFCSGLRGQLCFPLFPRGEPKKGEDRPLIPAIADDLKADTDELFKSNEVKADGGFFPVGPWGETRLWHGGAHITAKDGAPVFAPFPGRIVVARMGAESPVGSMNFVLLRHDMTLGTSKVQFYSLYMHIANELKDSKQQPEWMTKPDGSWKKQNAKGGTVVLLDDPIEAGALIGHVGKVGPGEYSKAQIHIEFFANSELFVGVPGSPFDVVDGTAGGRFCDAPKINDLIDQNHDGKLSRQEISNFYSGGAGSQMRSIVTFHVSEWTPEPSWADALRVPKDFKDMKPAEIDQMIAEQITPGLWWDPAVAKHAKLAPNGEVYHYNPVFFLRWFNQQLLDAAVLAPPAASEKDAKDIPKDMLDDFGVNSDKDGSSMRSEGEGAEDSCNKNLGLAELSAGFDAPECGPQ
ncbi:MAG: N-acetylmuramoyl-L-alanine amidase [Deltaproteobacteria bacterium]|nr:N-acetylmuramoyl-L-alanine amidase [Deltaproteobacteria bacterium]